MLLKKLLVLVATAAGLSSAPAMATTIYTYDGAADAAWGAGPFGTVTLSDLGGGILDVLVTLAPGKGFVDSGAGGALMFNLNGFPTLLAGNITSLTAGFAFSTSNPSLIHADGSGDWQYGIFCVTACGVGGSNPFAGPLEFKITLAGLTEASFIATAASHNNFFASDICNVVVAGPRCAAGANTGMVWTSTPPVARNVPEPATLALAGLGLLGLATIRRRRAS